MLKNQGGSWELSARGDGTGHKTLLRELLNSCSELRFS